MSYLTAIAKVQNWINGFLLTIAFCIPFAKRYVPGFLLLLGIACIIKSINDRKLYFYRKDFPLLLLAVLFGLHLLGVTYSENVDYAWTEIGIKLSFLVFPLLALVMPPIEVNMKQHIRRAFIYGCIGYMIVSVATGLYDSIRFDDFGYLSYEALSEPYHPTYAATYQAMTLFIMMLMASRGEFLFNNKILHRIICILILLFISMLASKAGLIAAWISIVMGAYCIYKSYKQLRNVIVVTLGLLLFSAGSAFLLPGASVRIENALKDVGTTNQWPVPNDAAAQQVHHEAHSSTELRLVTWSAAWELLLHNPFGAGTGDTTNELVKIYESKGENYAVQKALNAHNQFLQTAAELGWPALIVLCASLLLLFQLFFYNRDLLLLNFLLLCGMNFLFESFLEVQAGIMFFCFWVLVIVRQKPVLISEDKL